MSVLSSWKGEETPQEESALAARRTDGRTVRAAAKREARRAMLLDTALTVFGARGYHRTSIRDVIKAAGIARGTFYLYFESKSAIFHELLDELLRHLRRGLTGVDEGPGAPPVQRQLHDSLRRVIATLVKHRGLMRILLREASGVDEEVDRKLEEFWGNVHRFAVEALANGQRMGLIRDLDIDLVASCVIGSVRQVVDRSVSGGTPQAREIGTITDAILDYNLKGILAR